MSEVGIYHKINYSDDPPNVPDGALYVAVFFKKMSVTMCLTGLYWGIGLGQVILETIDELTIDPEDLPRLMFEFIPWEDVEMMVVLGGCVTPPEVATAMLTPLPGWPPIPNDVPFYHSGNQSPSQHRSRLTLPDMRYEPYHERFRTPVSRRNSFFPPGIGVKPFWENYLRQPNSHMSVPEPMEDLNDVSIDMWKHRGVRY